MPPLKCKVYGLLKTIPKGKVTTYKAIGDKLNTKAYRAIGQILKNNPYAPKVPCHRVVRGNGEAGGFDGSMSNQGKKIKMLEEEGIEFNKNSVKNFDEYLYQF